LARFEKVLVCVDGFESSMKAADRAVMLAKQNGAQVIALNVIVSQLGYAYSAGIFGLVTPNTINEFLERSKQEAQKWFDNIGKNAVTNGVKFKTEVVVSPYFGSAGNSGLCREE
jgi:nucleotide-binding universal stress UspA family protein